MKKWIKPVAIVIIIITVFLLLAFYLSSYFRLLPLATSYGSKTMCSEIFIANREEGEIRSEDFNKFPLNLVDFFVDYKDSSVTASVFGFAKRKAIFRDGIGSTLIEGMSEKKIRNQKFHGYKLPSIASQDTLMWPLGNKNSESKLSISKQNILNKIIEESFLEKDMDHPINTRAVIVIKDGKIIGEKYDEKFNRNTRFAGWSIAKSVTGTLVGTLLSNKVINLDSKVLIKSLQDKHKAQFAINLRQLLQQSSGLNFDEDYSRRSDATQMLFFSADMGQYAQSKNLIHHPGSFFHYSSGNPNIVMKILREQLDEKAYSELPYKFFDQIGMNSAIFERDPSGTYVGSSYIYATARDWARYGLFYLNGGAINGKQLISKPYFNETITPAPSTKYGGYGYLFWLNKGSKSDTTSRTFPNLPRDLFFASGVYGQSISIIPSKKIVIVRLGLSLYENFDSETFLKKILEATNY